MVDPAGPPPTTSTSQWPGSEGVEEFMGIAVWGGTMRQTNTAGSASCPRAKRPRGENAPPNYALCRRVLRIGVAWRAPTQTVADAP